MFLGEVISQERRSSSAIKMSRRESRPPESAMSSPITDKRKGSAAVSSPMMEKRKGSAQVNSPTLPGSAVVSPLASEKRKGLASAPRRKSSFFRNPAPVEPAFSWKLFGDNKWGIVQEGDGTETSLVFRRNQVASMKNFGVEVRGIRDVNNLLQDAAIILNPKTAVLEDLIVEIVGKIRTCVEGGITETMCQDVKEEIFTDAQAKIFATTLQGYVMKESRLPGFDQSWLCAFCNLSSISRRYVAIVRTKQPTNFGETCQEVRFLIFVFCPSKSKETKTALETGRTFATLFSDPNLRNNLLLENDPRVFKDILSNWALQIAKIPDKRKKDSIKPSDPEKGSISSSCCGGLGSGIMEDLKRRLPHYISDYTDGVADGRSISKTISTSVFLYFACLLPTIALANLNSKTTNGRMDVRKGIISQTMGQLIFAIIGGQHLSIVLTTAPLSLFIKIIFSLCEFYEMVDKFEAFYCCIGLWTSFFLFLSAICNLSRVMKFCTRSTEEIFALFISIAFVVYAITGAVHDFELNYNSGACHLSQNMSINLLKSDHNTSTLNQGPAYRPLESECHRDTSLLYLLLMFGTFWFGYILYNFKNTPFLQRNKREILSDYSLPLAVVLFSFIGSFLFRSVPAQRFTYVESAPLLRLAPLQQLEWNIILLSGALGFCLAVLIFMDQNIGSAIVNNPSNNLSKGPSYNWDLVVIAVINGLCSIFTLPWLHVALPHAPMHVKCLADIEERVEHGHIKHTVVRVRETRLTTILSHIVMGLSLLLLPYPLTYILPSVFDGLYLYMGITALSGNQLFERVLLIFTEQLSYPPSHYIRQVPQRKIHQFTLLQVVQLAVLCVVGFFHSPFVKVIFPLVLLFLLFARQKILPRLIEKKYLDVLD